MHTKRIVTFVLFVSLITAAMLITTGAAADMARTNGVSDLPAPYLVKDINPRTHGSGPRCVAAGDAYALCTAYDGLPGEKVWHSDGTEAGSFLLKKLFDKDADVFLQESTTTSSGIFYFAAREGCCQYEDQLWKSDGTETGTVRVKGFPSAEGLRSFVGIGETIFFLASGDSIDTFATIWKSAGAEANTKLFFEPGRGHFALDLVTHNDQLFFQNRTSSVGVELWASDGSVANTALLADINPGEPDSDPKQMVSAGSLLFFVANDGTHGRELWRSDGTKGGTKLVKDINKDSADADIENLTVMGDLVFFFADDGSGDALWRSDGTETGTFTVPVSLHQSTNLIISGENQVYVLANSSSDYIVNLWRSDGSVVGTTFLKEVGKGYNCRPEEGVLAAGNYIYFSSTTEAAGCELWRSNGTAEGTVMVQDVLPGSDSSFARPLAFVNGQILFDAVIFATDDTSIEGFDNELWGTDGKADGAALLLNINRIPHSSNAAAFTFHNNRLFFSADDGTYGPELFGSDGTENGTGIVADVRSGEIGSNIMATASAANGLVFAASPTGTGYELYVSDGTFAGTKVIKSFNDFPEYAYLVDMTEWNGYVFFNVTYSPSGVYEFWRTDGSTAGTLRLGEFYVEHMIPADSRLYFDKRNVESGGDHYSAPSVLASTDGTPGGTVEIEGLPEHDCTLGENQYEALGDTLFFAWCDSEEDMELWFLATPTDQPGLVRDINPSASSVPRELAAYGGAVYFTADDGANGGALWRSDGTGAGTEVVIEQPAYRITPFSSGFFFLNDGLWVSDGSEGGTEKLAEVGYVNDMVVAADYLFFAEADKFLMASDGTTAGTGVVGPGGAGLNPRDLTVAGDKLYFTAEDEYKDRELWAVSLPGSAPVADFTAAPLKGAPPLLVQFKNLSKGEYETCKWDFGDGSSASGCADQTHTYPLAGTYSVKLTVSGPGGTHSRTFKNHISVFEAVSADFSASPLMGTPPLDVLFSNLSSGDFDTCVWDFGDGKTKTTCGDPVHRYRQEGRYTVSLTVSGAGGEKTMAREAYIVVEKQRAFLPSVVRP